MAALTAMYAGAFSAHSLDACLPVLADLREKGWQVSLWSSRSAWRDKEKAR